MLNILYVLAIPLRMNPFLLVRACVCVYILATTVVSRKLKVQN